MKHIVFILLMAFLVSSFELSFQQALTAYLSTLPTSAKVYIQVESTKGQVYFSQFANEKVPSASIIKIPILATLMQDVQKGKTNLDDIYLLQESDKVGGAGTIMQQPDQTPLTYKELARQMIVGSDNTATNILIRKIGMERINTYMQSLKLNDLKLNRVMMDTAAVARGIDNYISAKDINKLLMLIYHKKIVTPPLCHLMIEFMLANDDNLTLPHGIPKGIKVAHKTGTLTYIRGDAGIIYTKKPFVISVMVQGVNTTEAEKIISYIGSICYQYLP